MDNPILALAQKLHALSLRGVDGERTTAEAMLRKLMAKHGITLEDLQLVQRTQRNYKYESTAHKDFIIQVWANVAPDALGSIYKPGRTVAIDLSHAEHLQMLLKLDHYWQLYQRELSIFYEAFIRKNDLVRQVPEDKQKSDLTPEEVQRIRRVMGMSQHIASETPHKRIGPA
jgi:hypothetical protein